MAVEFKHYHQLQVEKMQLVQSLTELNAQHIQTQSRLSGIEIDTARCIEAIDREDVSEDFELELRQLEKESEEIMRTRASIDQKRESLELKILALDTRLADLTESAEQ